MINKLRKISIVVCSLLMVVCSCLFVATATPVKANTVTKDTLQNSVIDNFVMENVSEMYIDPKNSDNAGIKFTYKVSKTWYENAKTLGDVTLIMYINKVGADDSLKTSIRSTFNGDFKGEDYVEISGALVYGNIIADYEAQKGVDLTPEQEEKVLNAAYAMDLQANAVAVITNNEVEVATINAYGTTVRSLNGVASSLLVNGDVTEEQKAVIDNYVSIEEKTSTYAYSFNKSLQGTIEYDELDAKYTAYLGAEKLPTTIENNTLKFTLPRALQNEGGEYNITLLDENGNGYKTKFNAYTQLITTKAELVAILPGAEDLNPDTKPEKHIKGAYLLGADIDCGNMNFTNYGAGANVKSSFEGIFDGNGHTISNFTVFGGGLFSTIVGDATIKNLAVTNVRALGTLFHIGKNQSAQLHFENIYVQHRAMTNATDKQSFNLWTGYTVSAKNVINVGYLTGAYYTGWEGDILINHLGNNRQFENIFIVHDNVRTIAESSYYASNEAGQTNTIANTYRFDDVATMTANDTYNNYVSDNTNKHWIINEDGTATWGYSFGNVKESMVYSAKDKLTQIDSKNIVSAVDANGNEYVVDGALTIENNTANVINKDLKVTFADDSEKLIRFIVYTDIITTKEELLDMMPGTAAANTVKDVKGAFILGADIYLGGTYQNPSAATGTFEGIFDGNGHKIDNFTIWNGGFFCKVKNVTTIKNVAFTNAITSHELLFNVTGAESDDLLTLENIFVSYKSGAQAFALWTNDAGFNVKANNIITISSKPASYKTSNLGNLLVKEVANESKLEANVSNLYNNIFIIHNNAYTIAEGKYYASNEAGQTKTLANTYRFDNVATMLNNNAYNKYVANITSKHWVVNEDGTAIWGYSLGNGEIAMNYSTKDKLTEIDSKNIVSAVDLDGNEYVVDGVLTIANDTNNVITKVLKVTFEDNSTIIVKFSVYTDIITSKQELLDILPGAEDLNPETKPEKHIKGAYILATDIDFGNSNFTNYGTGATAKSSFEGVFDGNGHTISNFTVFGGGIFSTIKGDTTIKNLAITNVRALGTLLFTAKSGTGQLNLENIYVQHRAMTNATDKQSFNLWTGHNVSAKNIINVGYLTGAYYGGWEGSLLINDLGNNAILENIFIVHDNVRTIAEDIYYASNEEGQTNTLANTYRFDDVATMLSNATYSAYVSDTTSKHWIVNSDGTATWGYPAA